MSKIFISVVLFVSLLLVGSLWYFSTNSPSIDPSTTSTSTLEVPVSATTTTSVSSLDSAKSTQATATTTQMDPNKKYMYATLHTNKGDIEIQFNATQTPNTVANFIKLAATGFYDGVKFHRVIKGFMIQGGDPLTKDDSQMARWGTGGPGYSFDDELTPGNKNDVGTIAMANSGPNTNGSQFFINVANNNFLDTKHVVFGKVVKGMDVVMAMSEVKTATSDRPVDPIVINSVTLK